MVIELCLSHSEDCPPPPLIGGPETPDQFRFLRAHKRLVVHAYQVRQRMAELMAGKEDLADVAKTLALNIGWYHQRCGDEPQDDLLRLVRT